MRAPWVGLSVQSEGSARRAGSAEIVAAVLREVSEGRLPAGARLPPVRVLENQLGISKNTAQAAYEELCARGVVEARAREGVFIALSRESATTAPPPAQPAPVELRQFGPLSASAPRGLLSLSSVFIDPELLPRERLADCFRAVLARPLRPMYDPQGMPALRALVAARLNARGFEISADEVIITTGSQQAIDLVARALCVPHIAHEDPVYSNARALFHSLQARTCPLPLDPFRGPDLDEWEARLAAARPSLLYAITSYHNPTGHSYSSRELSALLRLSERYGFALFEDDWGSDMLSGSEYRPTLRALGGPEVLYANSFTKKLLPSLRLGFLVASRRAIPALVAAKRVSILGNSLVLEAALAEFLERGYYDAHLSKAQTALDARYQLCLDVLRAEMPSDVRFTTPGGGPTLWLELPRRIDLGALQQRLAARGVHIEDTRGHFAGTPHLHGFRVGYAFLSEEDLARGLRILANALREPDVSA